jgi:hypothetical protein
MNKCSNEEQKNKVLHLTLNEYKETNDSIIDKIKTIQKELKLKENHLKQVQT